MNRHKISYFGLALALLGLVACSDDGEQQYKDARHTPMTFTVTHPSQTRATATDFENGDRIGLYVAQADAPLEIGGNLVNNEGPTTAAVGRPHERSIGTKAPTTPMPTIPTCRV